MGRGAKPGERRGGRSKGTPNKVPSLQQIKDAAAAKQGVTAERVVRELKRIAFADPRQVMKWGPDGVTLFDSETLTDEAAAIVAETSETRSEKGGSIRLKLVDKIAALDKLGRFLGIFADKLEYTGEGGGPVRHEIVVTRLDK